MPDVESPAPGRSRERTLPLVLSGAVLVYVIAALLWIAWTVGCGNSDNPGCPRPFEIPDRWTFAAPLLYLAASVPTLRARRRKRAMRALAVVTGVLVMVVLYVFVI